MVALLQMPPLEVLLLEAILPVRGLEGAMLQARRGGALARKEAALVVMKEASLLAMRLKALEAHREAAI